MDLTEKEIGLAYYELSQMAQSFEEALQMEKHRSQYFASLYDGVRMSSIPFGDFITEERSPCTDTAAQAMEIIDKKAAYDKTISRKRERYRGWQDFLNRFTEYDAELLRRHFEQGERMPENVLHNLLDQAADYLNSEDEEESELLDKQALHQYTELCNMFPYLRGKAEPRKPDTQQYFMNGKYVYATPEDYEVYQQQEREREKQFTEFLFDRTPAQ